jgi:hypothetical protein
MPVRGSVPAELMTSRRMGQAVGAADATTAGSLVVPEDPLPRSRSNVAWVPGRMTPERGVCARPFSHPPRGAGMGRVVVNGLDIAFQRQGKGPDMMLSHGGLCGSRVWRGALETLSGAVYCCRVGQARMRPVIRPA